MSEVLRESNTRQSAKSLTPAPVMVAGIGIIAIRFVGVALQMHESGLDELSRFVHRSAQSWDSTLIFIASQMLFFIQLRCALAVMRGCDWGRWGFAFSQLVIMSYLLMASMGWVYPELFNISDNSQGSLIPRLISAKLPDLLVLLLLYLPASSRKFFRHH